MRRPPVRATVVPAVVLLGAIGWVLFVTSLRRFAGLELTLAELEQDHRRRFGDEYLDDAA